MNHASFSLIAAVHAGTSCVMSGVVLAAQVVIYPHFRFHDAAHFRGAMRAHQSRITLLVAPTMLAELATGIVLVSTLRSSLSVTNAFVLAMCWLLTFLALVPLHTRLASEGNPQARTRLIASLVRWNGLRSIAWLTHAVLALMLFAGDVS